MARNWHIDHKPPEATNLFSKAAKTLPANVNTPPSHRQPTLVVNFFWQHPASRTLINHQQQWQYQQAQPLSTRCDENHTGIIRESCLHAVPIPRCSMVWNCVKLKLKLIDDDWCKRPFRRIFMNVSTRQCISIHQILYSHTTYLWLAFGLKAPSSHRWRMNPRAFEKLPHNIPQMTGTGTCRTPDTVSHTWLEP